MIVDMLNDLVIYLYLALSSILNIVVPVSGSAMVTPLLAMLTDPHRAIGLASFYFLLSGLVRVFLFRKSIQWREVRTLLPVSLLAALFGALTLVAIESTVMFIVILLFTVYFFLKKIRLLPDFAVGSHRYFSGFIGLLSGFLQGAGLAGSDLRNSYLLSKNMSISELHGTTAFVGASNFLVATVVRLYTNQLTLPDLAPLLFILPFIVMGTLLGRRILYKLSKKVTNSIVITVMAVIIVALLVKLLSDVL